MKSEKEICDKIKVIKKEMENYEKAFVNGKINQNIFDSQFANCESIINSLEWILEKSNKI